MTLADRSRPTHRTRPTHLAAPRAGTAGHRAGEGRPPRLRIVAGGADTAPTSPPNALPWNVYAREAAFHRPAASSRPPASHEDAETSAPSRSADEPGSAGAAAFFWFDWFPMLFLGILTLASATLSLASAIAR